MSSAPEAPKASSSPAPPPPSATPPAAAPKKRTKRKANEDGSTPTAKKPKKSEAAKKTEATADATSAATPTTAKKTTTRKKQSENDDVEDQVVEKGEQDRRLAEIEAEMQEMETQDKEEPVEADSWQDQNVSKDQETYRLYGRKLTTLYHLMTPEQKERFDNYRRSGFQESELKEHVLDPLKVHASSEAITVLRAIGKVFIGELMDKAIEVMIEWGDEGNVRPVHLREAQRRIEESGEMPSQPPTLKFGRPRR